MTDIRFARPEDSALIVQLIGELADYEKLSHEVVVTEAQIREHLFGPKPHAEVLIAEDQLDAMGFALFFHNFSTFLGRPGLYLEDLFVRPAFRQQGVGKAFLARLAALAEQRGCGRLEWAVLDWNKPAIDFYEKLGAQSQSDWTTYRMTGKALTELAASINY